MAAAYAAQPDQTQGTCKSSHALTQISPPRGDSATKVTQPCPSSKPFPNITSRKSAEIRSLHEPERDRVQHLYNEASMLVLFGLPSTIDWRWVWLLTAAFLAGVLNAVAGGGSFLLFPAMLSTGMLPVQANATNTVALWPGQVTSIAAYWSDILKIGAWRCQWVWPA